MCSLELPKGIIEKINNALKHYFWRKYGMEDRGTTLISWNKFCLPKDQGGLGVLNIEMHNKRILTKHLHKFLHRENLPWVNLIWESYYPDGVVSDRPTGSFWWKSILKLMSEFKAVTKGQLGAGNTIDFGLDNWGHGITRDNFPELYSFATQDYLSIKEFLQASDISANFLLDRFF